MAAMNSACFKRYDINALRLDWNTVDQVPAMDR
jgi:hypothetical protein